LVSWKARPMPRRVRCEAARRVMSSPNSETVPELAGSWPETRLK
jgi:hypothetical protein